TLVCCCCPLLWPLRGAPGLRKTRNQLHHRVHFITTRLRPSHYRLQQRFSFLQVGGVKPLGKPAVDRRQQVVSCRALALLLPQARQAHRRAQFQRLGLLLPSDRNGLPEILFHNLRDLCPASTAVGGVYAELCLQR